jgi:hypothetical protein
VSVVAVGQERIMAKEPGTGKMYSESDTDEPGHSDTGRVDRQRAEEGAKDADSGDEPKSAQEPPD